MFRETTADVYFWLGDFTSAFVIFTDANGGGRVLHFSRGGGWPDLQDSWGNESWTTLGCTQVVLLQHNIQRIQCVSSGHCYPPRPGEAREWCCLRCCAGRVPWGIETLATSAELHGDSVVLIQGYQQWNIRSVAFKCDTIFLGCGMIFCKWNLSPHLSPYVSFLNCYWPRFDSCGAQICLPICLPILCILWLLF